MPHYVQITAPTSRQLSYLFEMYGCSATVIKLVPLLLKPFFSVVKSPKAPKQLIVATICANSMQDYC